MKDITREVYVYSRFENAEDMYAISRAIREILTDGSLSRQERDRKIFWLRHEVEKKLGIPGFFHSIEDFELMFEVDRNDLYPNVVRLDGTRVRKGVL